MSKVKKGFSFTELLTILSIQFLFVFILILLLNPSSLLERGRDYQRIKDLDILENALLEALSDNSIELIDSSTCSQMCTSTKGFTNVDGTGYVRFKPIKGFESYIQVLPLDPTNSEDYFYSYKSDGKFFELNAVLESKLNSQKMEKDGGDNEGVYEIGTKLGLIQ